MGVLEKNKARWGEVENDRGGGESISDKVTPEQRP